MSVKMFWKAASTFEASNAEVSMNDSPFSEEKVFASSVGTALKCF